MLQTSIRNTSLQDTLQHIDKYIQLAKITRVADITNLDYYGIPVFASFRPMGKSLSTSQGKGFIKDAALCGAYMEAIEVYFSEEVVPQIFLVSAEEIAEKYQIINPTHFSSINYPSTYKHNWVLGSVLNSNTELIAIPHQLVSIDSTNKDVILSGSHTTGLASGNTLTEALLHGGLEVIERNSGCTNDEIMNVNIENNPLIADLSAKANIWITLLLNKYNIPVFKCVIQNKDFLSNRHFFSGFGCHLNKQIALNRAITEAFQSSATIIAGSRDDIDKTMYLASTENMRKYEKSINYSAISSFESPSVDENWNYLKNILMPHNETFAYYTYLNAEIAIIKAFIVKPEQI